MMRMLRDLGYPSPSALMAIFEPKGIGFFALLPPHSCKSAKFLAPWTKQYAENAVYIVRNAGTFHVGGSTSTTHFCAQTH